MLEALPACSVYKEANDEESRKLVQKIPVCFQLGFAGNLCPVYLDIAKTVLTFFMSLNARCIGDTCVLGRACTPANRPGTKQPKM